MNDLHSSPRAGAQSSIFSNPPSNPPPVGLAEHLRVLYQDTATLIADPRNARTHSPAQVRQIAASIEQFGFINPILVDAQNRLIAGHGRLAAARELSMCTVPTLCIDHLSTAEQRAYAIADNRLAELAGWDREILGAELLDLATLELDFAIEITGFGTGEIDVLLGETDEAGDAPEPPAVPDDPVTRPGDLWHIGPHRLLCADATERDSYTQLLGDRRAELIFTDPPYNVPINGHVSGLGKVQHDEFAMATGEMSADQFTAFLTGVLGHLATVSTPGSIHFVCMDWRHMDELLAAGAAAYDELKNLCVWTKTNGGMGSLYRSQHELVFVYKSGQGPHINNVELGKHGRYRTNVWSYAGVNTFRAERDAELSMHPTVKPLALIEDALRDCSRRRGLVLDPFCGSGTTLVAAHRTGRRGVGLELDPRYCDVIVQRLAEATGETPVLVSGDRSCNQVAELRGVDGGAE